MRALAQHWSNTEASLCLRFRLSRQFLRYILSGLLTLLVDLLVMMVLTVGLGLHYLPAAILGFLAALVVHYLTAIFWVFEHRRFADWRREAFIFSVICGLGIVENYFLMLLLVEGLALNALLAKFLTTGFLFVFNYVFKKHLLFKKSGSALMPLRSASGEGARS